MKKVRYGIIGCGAIAQRRHIPEAAANEQSQVVAIADPVRGRAQSIAQPLGAVAYTDYKKMLKEQQLDAAVVCGPNVMHAPMAIDAFKAKLHVLVEKPMATTRAEAKKMIAAAKQAPQVPYGRHEPTPDAPARQGQGGPGLRPTR